MTGPTPYVFISYGRDEETNTFVERLHDDLEKQRFGVWLDRRDIGPADDWDAHIQDGLDNCYMLLFVVTPKSLESEVCRAEWNRVLSAGKPVLPIMLGLGLTHDSLPFRLQLRQWIDFRPGYAEALLELLAFLRRLEAQKDERVEAAAVAVTVVQETNLEKASALLVNEAEDMPRLPLTFVARTNLQLRIQSLLNRDNTRVLLQGYGGVGKTALAARVAADYMQAQHSPVLWLYAGDEDADALLEALAYPFNLHQAINREPAAAKPQLMKQILRENNIGLVVVDDIWNEDALPTLLDAIPPSIPALFTSRQRYTLTGAIIRVGELSPSDALRMLSLYADQTFEEHTAQQVAALICEQVGYHAFALEIAGRILQVDEITPANLLEQIKDAPHDLEMPEGLAVKGRTSVWDLITRSLMALEDETRSVFLTIGALFTPRVTPRLLAMVMGRTEDQINAALKTLQRRALVERVDPPPDDQPYYRFHALSFSYARQIFLNRKSGFEPSLETCRLYTIQHAEDVTALNAELGNLLGAVEFASQSENAPDHQIAIDIMKVLAKDYLSARGHTEYFRRMLDVTISLSRQQTHAHCMDLFVLVAKRGNTHADQGNPQATFEHYHEAYELAHLVKQTGKEILALSEIGSIRADTPGATDADEFLERAQALAEKFEDGCWLGRVFLNRGYVAHRRDDLPVARDHYANAVANAERCEDEVVLFFALCNLGTVERQLGHPEIARPHHERALQMALKEQSRAWEAQATQSLGEDEHVLGHDDQAKTLLIKARELFREIENKTKEDETIDYMRQAGYLTTDGVSQ